MDLTNLLAVSGLPGIYKIVSSRSNGLIIEDFVEGKRRFASSRKHQFTPLASIAIYTDDGDSTELKNVFRNMLDQYADNPPPDSKAAGDELEEYFADVLPTYDPERVRIGDIKKVIKWFSFLKEHDLLTEQAGDSTSEEE